MRMNSKRYLVAAVCFPILLCGAIVLLAQVVQDGDALKPDTEIVAEQYLVIGNPTRAGGESQVAINPLNPNQIAIASMGVMNQNDGNFSHIEGEFKRTPRYVITEFAITRDRGLTWHVTEDPMRKFFGRYRCLDPFATFTPDGVMILGCEAHAPTTLTPEQQVDATLNNLGKVYGGSAIIWSTDGGHTFSDPVEIISTNMPKELFGPWVSFAPRGTTGDAPKITVDASNGMMYVDGNSTAADGHSQTVLRSSKDRGRDWGMVYAFDSAEWPGSGGTMSSAKGVLGIVYRATKVPTELNAKCPCVVFGASRDGGKTFDRHIVPVNADGENTGLGGGVLIAADPTKADRFGIVQQTPGQVVAYYTEDGGKTWSSGKPLGKIPNTSVGNLTAAYNSKGVLGVAWRVTYPSESDSADRGARGGRGAGGRGAAGRGSAPSLDRTHGQEDEKSTSEIWSAISKDGGKTFSSALKVSTAPSPGISRRRGGSGHSADFDSIALDNDFVHMTWFDMRAGFLGTWYGRVPIADYK